MGAHQSSLSLSLALSIHPDGVVTQQIDGTPAAAGRTLPGMTRLSSLPEHEIAIECKVCGHAGPMPVAAVLAKGDRTVAELVAAARCSRCWAKIVGTYRIVYGRRSDIAMAMTASMPQDT